MLRLLTQREAATLLRLSERTLERLRVTGAGPVYVKAGRSVRYRECHSACNFDPLSWGIGVQN
jgi:Helix-turn-helix domain